MPRRGAIAGALGHGLALAVVNLASAWAGFVVFHLANATNQVETQLPVAVLSTVVGFGAWVLVTRRSSIGWGRVARRERILVFTLTLFWSAALFAPLHLATQGYLTAWSNIFSLWSFQVAANAAAMWVADRLAPELTG